MALSQEWNFTTSDYSFESGTLKKNGIRHLLLGVTRHTVNTKHET